MARPGVTYQDIVLAANELKGHGKNITIENIRTHLGTGSIGTINKYLRQWREIQNSTDKIASKENLPEELVSLMKGLWDGIVTQSIERFEPVEENYQREIGELKQELEKYKSNNQRWQKLFNQWQQEKAQLSTDKLTLEQALDFSHKENQSLNGKYDGLLQQVQEKQERIDELRRLHKQAQENLEHYRESAREQRLLDQQQFEQQKQQLLSEIKTLNEQCIVQREQMSTLQQHNHLLSQSFSVLEKDNSQYSHQIEQLKNKIEVTEKTQHEYADLNQNLKGQLQEMQKRLENTSAESVMIQAEIKIASQQLVDTKQLLCDTQDQNKLLAHEKWALGQEKAHLEGQLKQMQKIITT